MRLWENNRVDQEWELPDEEIIDRFLASDYRERFVNLDRALRFFLANNRPPALNSVWEPTDYDLLFAKLWRRLYPAPASQASSPKRKTKRSTP